MASAKEFLDLGDKPQLEVEVARVTEQVENDDVIDPAFSDLSPTHVSDFVCAARSRVPHPGT